MERTSQREKLFKLVGPAPGNKYAIFNYKGGPEIKSIKDLIKEKVGVIRKDIEGKALIDKDFPKRNLEEVSRVKELFDMVKKKRINFLIWTY